MAGAPGAINDHPLGTKKGVPHLQAVIIGGRRVMEDSSPALHVRAGGLASSTQTPIVGLWVRGCILLVWPAIRALKDSWAKNREYSVDRVSFGKLRASCKVVALATEAASATFSVQYRN